MAQLELHTDPHVASYHVRKRLAAGFILWVDTRKFVAGEQVAFSPVPSDSTLALLKDLYAIEGIEKVDVDSYAFSLHKARAFSWNELDAQINEALQNHGLE